MINYKKIIIELKQIVLKNSYVKEKFINLNVFKIFYLKYLIDNEFIDVSKDKLIDLFQNFSISGILEYIIHEENNEIDDYPVRISYADSKLITELLMQKRWFDYNSLEKLCYIYVNLYNIQHKKKEDIVYIPNYISDTMFNLVNVQINKDTKFLDPACGNGSFVLKMYDMFYEKLNLNLEPYEKHKFILDYNLYACEINDIAVICVKLILSLKNKKIYFSKKIICGDILLEELYAKNMFDIILTYLPEKRVEQYNKKEINFFIEKYNEDLTNTNIFYNCLFKKMKQLLKNNGSICCIINRNFLEFKHFYYLREILLDNFRINHIIDFSGIKIIQNANTKSAIISLENVQSGREKNILVRRAIIDRCEKISTANLFRAFNGEVETDYFEKFYYASKKLKPKIFLFIDETSNRIREKIESKSLIQLKDILNVHQGVITGFDKAFVFIKNDEKLKKFDQQFIKPWIKSSDIDNYYIKPNNFVLLYSNDLEINKNINEIKYLTQYQKKLLQRRECINGKLPWYYLQWGRTKEVFQMPKIIYSCKAEKNRFALDSKGSYFSADVYALTLKSHAYNISYEYLCILLNSGLYDFYYKTFAKKLSKKRYEYSPEDILKLKIPIVGISNENIKKAYRQINYSVDTDEYLNNLNEINTFVYKLFDLTNEEIAYIENKGAQICTK